MTARRPFRTALAAEGGGGGGGGRASAAVVQGKPAKSAEKLDLNPPKGTRDFYPEDMRLRTWLFDHWRGAAARFGFEEYDAPVLEAEALYVRKSGEEVTQQLYNFQDKGDRRVALRPEMTPSLARMVMAKKGGLPLPLKWMSIPQCWRYERMTRGRRREHFQWNMDIWGVQGIQAEAELLAAMVHFFREVGLTPQDVGIKVNSRAILGEVLGALGVPEDKFAATCVLVDKLEKVKVDDIREDMNALGLTDAIIEKLLAVLAVKDLSGITELLGGSSQSVRDLTTFFELAEAYGYADWLLFDASVVRGLAYYTGIVFEAFDKDGELRAIAGGGRYDKLLESFGGEAIPAVGFGFGDAVIVELLKVKGLMPDVSGAGPEVAVFAMDPELYPTAVAAATALRAAGRRVELVLEDRKPKWFFKHADRLGASHAVLVGREEAERGEVSVKDLVKREQASIKLEEVDAWITSTTNQP